MNWNKLTTVGKLLGSNTPSRIATLSAIIYEVVDISTKYNNGNLDRPALIQAAAILVLGLATNEVNPASVYAKRPRDSDS